MIQRIQSLYLLSVIAISILLFYVPYCNVQSENPKPTATEQSFLLQSQGIYKILTQKNELQLPTDIFNIINIVLIGMSTLSIFLFKNRKLQMRMVKIVMLIVIIFFSSINYELFKMTDLSGSSGHIRFLLGWYIPFAQIILLVLSNRAIQKDEDLVRSADRLR